jgi:hypothetical protein
MPLARSIVIDLSSNRHKVERDVFMLELQALEGPSGQAPNINHKSVTGMKHCVTIGDGAPHCCLYLSALTPQCPTNLPSLPETVRSGTGS